MSVARIIIKGVASTTVYCTSAHPRYLICLRYYSTKDYHSCDSHLSSALKHTMTAMSKSTDWESWILMKMVMMEVRKKYCEVFFILSFFMFFFQAWKSRSFFLEIAPHATLQWCWVQLYKSMVKIVKKCLSNCGGISRLHVSMVGCSVVFTTEPLKTPGAG